MRVLLTCAVYLIHQQDDALECFGEALAVPTVADEDKIWFLTQRIRIYISRNDMVSAADDAVTCIEVNPANVESYEKHCDALVGIGDLDSARSCAHVGLMHAPNHKNETLENLLERIAQGNMPKVAMSRVFIKQILRPTTEKQDVPRLLRKWDGRL